VVREGGRMEAGSEDEPEVLVVLLKEGDMPQRRRYLGPVSRPWG
jgi:hypothetical protein